MEAGSISNQAEEPDSPLEENDQHKVVKKEESSPGLIVAIFLLIAAGKTGLFEGDLSKAE